MNTIRQIMGFVWALAGPTTIFMMLYTAFYELQNIKAEKLQETVMFWVITISIFVPIAFGLTVFGWYAIQGEYKEKI